MWTQISLRTVVVELMLFEIFILHHCSSLVMTLVMRAWHLPASEYWWMMVGDLLCLRKCKWMLFRFTQIKIGGHGPSCFLKTSDITWKLSNCSMSPLSFLIPTAYIGNFQTILHWGNWLEICMKLIKKLLDLWLGVITQKYIGEKLTKARRTWSKDGKIPNVNWEHWSLMIYMEGL